MVDESHVNALWKPKLTLHFPGFLVAQVIPGWWCSSSAISAFFSRPSSCGTRTHPPFIPPGQCSCCQTGTPVQLSLQAVGQHQHLFFKVLSGSTAKPSQHGESLLVRYFNPLGSFPPSLELVLLSAELRCCLVIRVITQIYKYFRFHSWEVKNKSPWIDLFG